MRQTYVTSDAEWSKQVRQYYHRACAWAGCGDTYGLGGHHIIPRGYKALRLLLENGVELCAVHHGIVEAAIDTPRYDKIMTLLVGKERYDTLVELKALALNELKGDTVQSDALKTSEVSFE